MSGQFVETPTRTYEAGGAIAQYLRVKFSSGKLAAAGLADADIGTIQKAVFANLDDAAVRLRSAQGSCLMVASAEISQGAKVFGAAAGKISATQGVNSDLCGVAMEAAAANGDVIEVVRVVSGGNTYMPAAASDARSGAGAVSVVTYLTKVTTTGADALTLADGVIDGQLKKVQMVVDGGEATLTPVTLVGGDTITFADAGDLALLMWTAAGWIALELTNDVDGATGPVLA